MSIDWTLEKLSALPPPKLEQLRQNAADRGAIELQQQIERLQTIRKPPRAPRRGGAPDSPVIGFHFICPDDYEVELLSDGRFWSGVWAAANHHCDPAIEMRGYVALHKSRKHASHRQGTLVGWRHDGRTKGARQLGVSFLLVPFDTALPWYGGGAGEKGYRYVSDLPPWQPKL